MPWIARVAVSVGLAVFGVAAFGLPAGAHTKVGPHQFFTGLISGKDGNTTVPITIRMDCAGPLSLGETGHPVAGQTLAVRQLFPPSATGSGLGNTGTGSVIGAFFHGPPPASTPLKSAQSPSFTRYDKPKKLPTSETLPCSGKGTVWFVPIPVVPPSQSQAVPVRFVSLAD